MYNLQIKSLLGVNQCIANTVLKFRQLTLQKWMIFVWIRPNKCLSSNHEMLLGIYKENKFSYLQC